MTDSLDEAVRCAEEALRDPDGSRFELVARLMLFLEAGADDCLANGTWDPATGAAGVHLGRLLLELGLRQGAERMFRLLSTRLHRQGVPESHWGEQGEPFVNCLGVLGISLGRQAEARAVLRCAVPLDREPRLSPAAAATRVNLAAVEAGLGNVDSAVAHALTARALLDRLPESEDRAVRALRAVLDAVDHQLLGFAPRFGDHATRTLSVLAQRTDRTLDGLDSSDPQAFLAVVNFALVRAGAAVEAGDTDVLETVAKVVEVAAQRLATLLGADHPTALGVQADLAAVQIEAARAVRSPDRLERAVRLLAATAQRLEILLGPAHPRTVGALTNLVAAQVETVRALPAPGKARRTADALAERALQFGELLGERHPVTRLVSASAATCRRMAAGDEGGRDFGGTTLVRTLVDSPGDWQEDGEVYRSFREAVNAVGPPPTPGDGVGVLDIITTDNQAEVSGYPLGSLVTGVVSEIDQHEVEVEVGDIDRGVVLRHELSSPDVGHPSELVAYGDELGAVVIGREQGYEGRLLLSMKEPLLREALRRRTLAESAGLPSDGVTVSGRVVEVVEDGLAVQVGDGTALLPTADIEEEPVRDPQRYVGQILDAKAWVHPSGSLVLSRRAWLEEAAALQPHQWLAHVQVGQVRTGRVTGAQSQDVVVNLGSFRGLLDLADLETGRVAVGDLVTARVSAVDRVGGQVFLELLEGERTSWQRFMETHRPGRIVRGTVTKIAPNGVFAKVADGVRGWVGLDDLADDQVASNMPAVVTDEKIFVRVVAIDPDRCWVVLSAREADAVLGTDPAAAEFAPELYGDAPDFDPVTARGLFELHRQNAIERHAAD